MRRRPLLLIPLIAGLLVILIVVFTTDTQPGDRDNMLTIYAAASLTDAFEEIAAAFEAQYPDVNITLNFAGSSTLAVQIIEGAPADLFASANPNQMQRVNQAGALRGTPQLFARNQPVLIVPVDNPAQVESPRDLMRPGLMLVVAAPDVPVREYTDTLVRCLEDDPNYGAAFAWGFADNIISEEAHVRLVTARIALGEADAGIVYRSDVTPDLAADIHMIPLPDSCNPLAMYPIAITERSDNPELATQFIDFVLSPAGQAILARWNLIPVVALEN